MGVFFRRFRDFLICDAQAQRMPRAEAKAFTVSCTLAFLAFDGTLLATLLIFVVPPESARGFAAVLLFDLFFDAAYLSTWLMLRFGWVRTAKAVLFTAAHLQIFALTLSYGLDGGSLFYYFAAFVAPLMMFTSKDRVLRTVAMTVAIGLFSFFVYYYQIARQPPPFPMASNQGRVYIFLIINAPMSVAILGICVYYFYRAGRIAEDHLEEERRRSEELLLNILPGPVADRLKRGEQIIADRFENATVLFADIVDFTPISSRLSPEELVRFLNDVFSGFDSLADQLGLEKIKTIGDAYMVVGGVPEKSDEHAAPVARMALAMREQVRAWGDRFGFPLKLRIGLHSGPLVAGVIGRRKFIYDLWGDTVNMASRMEAHGRADSIHVSADAKRLLESEFQFESRGVIDVKGKGSMETFFLLQPV